jgi:Arc/MetJ-type ribon-helix-helix transcriptional regulator
MDVQLTEDQRAFARLAVQAGRFKKETDAVQEALALWEERERQRMEFRTSIDVARAALTHGEGREITPDSMLDLSVEIKQRGQARLKSHPQTAYFFSGLRAK